MVSAWFRLRQKGMAELRFHPKLDHVETETSRNWISSVSCSDLQSDDVIFPKQWAGLTAWNESSQVHSASPPQPTRCGASRLIIKAVVLCTVLNQTTPYNVLSCQCPANAILRLQQSTAVTTTTDGLFESATRCMVNKHLPVLEVQPISTA